MNSIISKIILACLDWFPSKNIQKAKTYEIFKNLNFSLEIWGKPVKEKRCSCIQSNKLYLFCGLFNSVSLVFTNKSLQYVSYPVQVLGKACRPIPVIIFSALIAKKFHSIQKWIAVILITGMGYINDHSIYMIYIAWFAGTCIWGICNHNQLEFLFLSMTKTSISKKMSFN